MKDHDAVVCAVGVGGIATQVIMIDAAEAAGVKRFVVDDFGWGPNSRTFPEFEAIRSQRQVAWDHAKARAEANQNFTWTGITIGNPIDWVGRLSIDIAHRLQCPHLPHEIRQWSDSR